MSEEEQLTCETCINLNPRDSQHGYRFCLVKERYTSNACEEYEQGLCHYSNCFRPAYKIRGFIKVCEFHLKNPKKWGKDGKTFTGSVFVKKE